jgi:hypothetical protein
MEDEGRNGNELEENEAVQVDSGPIVVEVKKRPRSEKQIESLRAAQVARKAKAEARRAAREEQPAPAPSPEPVRAVSAEPQKPQKDYRAIYKQTKRELELLRFERAVAERLQEVKQEQVVKEEPKKKEDVPMVRIGGSWTSSAAIHKKNVGPSW